MARMWKLFVHDPISKIFIRGVSERTNVIYRFVLELFILLDIFLGGILLIAFIMGS
jgi:hypothetical protein